MRKGRKLLQHPSLDRPCATLCAITPPPQEPPPPSSDKPLIAACGTFPSHLSAFCLIPQHLCPTSIGFTFDPSQHLTSHLSARPLLLLRSS